MSIRQAAPRTHREARPGAAVRRASILSSSSGLVSVLLNAAMVALSARHGQTHEIAAYTLVTAVIALVAIAAGGGSPLLYVSGDSAQRRAVRGQWLFIVLPSVTVGIVLVVAFYTRHGYQWSPLVAVGVVAIGNNLAQLQLGDLARQMRFAVSAAVVCGSKLPAVLLVAAGVRLTTALLLATVVQFVAMEVALHRTSWLRRAGLAQLSLREAVSVFRTNRVLFTYAVAESYSARASSVVLSLFATPAQMGCFGAVAGAYQALGGVLTAGAHVSMVARARHRHGLDEKLVRNWSLEIMAILAAVAAAGCAIVAAGWVTGTILQLPIAESADWLRVLVIALPFMLITRSVALNCIGDGDYRSATKVSLVVAAIITPAAVLAVPVLGPSGAAYSTLLAESVTVALIAGAFVYGRETAKRGKGNGVR